MMSCKTCFLPLIFILSAFHSVWAQTVIYVDDDAPLGGDGQSWATAYRFLQDGLAVAQEGDEVHVAQGLYKPDCNEMVPEGTGDRSASFQLNGRITLKGGYAGLGTVDPDVRDVKLCVTTLSGDLLGNDAEPDPASFLTDPTIADNSIHVVVIAGPDEVQGDSNEELEKQPRAVIEGVRVTGGAAIEGDFVLDYEPCLGGGVYIAQGCALIRDCDFVANRALYGGGLHQSPTSQAKVKNCRFFRNMAEMGGGTFREGLTKLGTIVHEVNKEIVYVQCEFKSNWAQATGGGLAGRFVSNALIQQCQFIKNDAARGGGLAIWLSDGVTVSDSEFNQNSAFPQIYYEGGGFGGAMIFDVMTCDLFNCLAVGNSSLRGGGVISANRLLEMTIVNCTAQGNLAGQGGFISDYPAFPGIESLHTDVTIENCIVDNGGNDLDILNCHPYFSYNNLTDPNVFDGFAPSLKQQWLATTLFTDPCFVASGCWDDNSTPDDPNDDYFVAGDYHLKSEAGHWDAGNQIWIKDDVTSLCIDAGHPDRAIGMELMPNGGRINMGVYGGTLEASRSLPYEEPETPDPNETGGSTGAGR